MNDQRTSRNELADKLHGMGDSAYCRACDLSKRELCLGEEAKIKSGAFTLANLKALEEIRAEFGRANGLWEAAKIVRAIPSETVAPHSAIASADGSKCESKQSTGSADRT